MWNELTDRLIRRSWTDAGVQKYVGNYRNAWLTHCADPAVRQLAASGGSTTGLLLHGLEERLFDAAIVCRTWVENSKVRARFGLAQTPAELLEAQGSKYVETRFLREVLPLIRGFDGRVAVVGLPCDLTHLLRWEQKDPDIEGKIALTIGLVCGHNSRVELIDSVVSRLERQAGKPISQYRFRVGHWRGELEAQFADGSVLRKPSKSFNDYQNLFFFCERKCMACHDHYAYDADITAGDVWLFRLRDDPIKHTGIIVRSERGQEIMDSARSEGKIVAAPMDIRDIMDGQSRIGPAHYNVSARAKVGRLFSLKLKDTVREPVSWHAWLNALMSIGNMRMSETTWGRRLIFAIPRPVWRGLLYLKKGLETLR